MCTAEAAYNEMDSRARLALSIAWQQGNREMVEQLLWDYGWRPEDDPKGPKTIGAKTR